MCNSILITWDDMLKAQERIKKEGFKIASTTIPTEEEYQDKIDKFKEKYKECKILMQNKI